jgi:hypothetical protein
MKNKPDIVIEYHDGEKDIVTWNTGIEKLSCRYNDMNGIKTELLKGIAIPSPFAVYYTVDWKDRAAPSK